MVNASTLVFSTQPQANVALLRRHKCNIPDLSIIVSISWHLWAFYFLDKSLPLSSSSIIFPTLFRRRQSRRGVTKKEVWGHIGNRQRTSILFYFINHLFKIEGATFHSETADKHGFSHKQICHKAFHGSAALFTLEDWSFPFWIYLDRGSFSGQSNHQMSFCREPSLRLFMFAQRPGKWKCVNIFVRLKCCSKHFLISSYLWSWAFTREMNRPPRFKCWMSLHCKLQAVTLAKIVRVWCALFFTLDLLSYCE